MDEHFTSHVVAGAPDSKIVFPFFGFPGILLSYYVRMLLRRIIA